MSAPQTGNTDDWKAGLSHRFDVADLARVTAELGASTTLHSVVDAAVTHLTEAVGAAVATLLLVDGGQVQLVGGRGLRDGIEQAWATFRLDGDNPASEAAREVRPVIVRSAVDMDARYPGMRGELPAGRSLLAIPVPAAGGPPAAAVLGLTFADEWLPDASQMDVLVTLAGACGQALERLAASQEIARQTGRLAFLADASSALSSSLDYRTTLQTVADLAVPALADWCAVDVVENGIPVTVAIAHVDREKVAWAWDLQTRYPTRPDAPTGSPNVIRTGESELYAEIPDELLVAAAVDEEHLRLSRDLGMRSALIVPLAARGHTHGALLMIRTDSGRAYDRTDLALAEDLGRRAGLAIDNAQLFAEVQNVATRLQRAVLPDTIDPIDGWDLASYYAPGDAADVGGDFFDAIALPDGRVAVVIGDVMGHGLAAAAGMAQLRASVRAYLVDDPDPEAVLTRLDRLFSVSAPTRMASIVVGVLDPDTERLRFVNAGHHPPLVIDQDGAARLLWTTPLRPLGASLGPRTALVSTVALPASSRLLLFTDGLVERRGELIDVSFERLTRHAAVLRSRTLTTGLQELVARMDPSAGDDDVTALAIGRDTAGTRADRPASTDPTAPCATMRS